MRGRGAILLAAATAVVLVAAVWLVPDRAAPARATADPHAESTSVLSSAVAGVETLSSAPNQALDRWSRLPHRERALLPMLASVVLAMAMAPQWRKPEPIAGRVLECDRARVTAPRAPPAQAVRL